MINPFGVTGVPGGMGGSTLGLGIVISLHDQFSKQSTRVQQRMRMMDRQADMFARRMNKNLGVLNASIAGLGAGVVGLAALSFPMRDAMEFEEAIKRLLVVVQDLEKVGGQKGLENIALDLAAMFPQDPTQMSDALATVVKAGIENVDKAKYLLREANKLAVATNADLSRVVEGFTSIVHAYQVGLDDAAYTAEEAAERFNRVGSMLFETMKFGKFSDVPGKEDIEAMAKQFGQIAPTAAGMNIPMSEFFAIWAASTLGGQNARRSATGLRQSFMDILNRSRDPDSMPRFMKYLNEQGIEHYDGDLARVVQERGYIPILDMVRDFASLDNPGQLKKMMETENFQRRLQQIQEGVGDMSIDEAMAKSPMARDLINEVSDVGGLEISKISEVFRSIWGLTASLPLLTVQNENIKHIKQLIKEGADRNRLQEAFNEMMDTGIMQWRRMTSLIKNASILIGQTLLEEVKAMLKFFNQMLIAFQAFVQANETLVGILVRIATSGVVFITMFSAVMALRAGFNLLNLAIINTMRQFMLFPRLANFGLVLSFRDIMTVITLVTVGIFALRRAWESNFGGIQETVTEAWSKIKLVHKAISELFRTFDLFGQGYISLDLYEQLEEAGIAGFTIRLYALLFRLRKAFQGFKRGFGSFFDGIVNIFTAFHDNVLKPILHYFGIADDFLTKLWKPTQENVNAFEAWGERIGFVTAALVSLVTATRILWFFSRLTLITMNLSKGFAMLGLAMMRNPIVLTLTAIAGAAYYAYRNFESVRNVWDSIMGMFSGDGVGGLTEALGGEGLNRPLDRFLDKFDEARSLILGRKYVMPGTGEEVRDPVTRGDVHSAFHLMTGMTWSDFTDELSKQWDELVRRFQNLFERIKRAVNQGAMDIRDGFLDIARYIGESRLFQNLRDAFVSVASWWGDFFQAGNWSGVWDQFIDTATQLGRTIVAILNAVGIAVDRIFGEHGTLPETLGRGLTSVLITLMETMETILIYTEELFKWFSGDFNLPSFQERMSNFWEDKDKSGVLWTILGGVTAARFGAILLNRLKQGVIWVFTVLPGLLWKNALRLGGRLVTLIGRGLVVAAPFLRRFAVQFFATLVKFALPALIRIGSAVVAMLGGPVAAAIVGVITLIGLMVKNWDAIGPAVMGVFKWIGNGLNWFVDLFWGLVQDAGMIIVDTFREAGIDIYNALIPDSFERRFLDVFRDIENVMVTITDTLTSLWTGFWDTITNPGESLSDMWSGQLADLRREWLQHIEWMLPAVNAFRNMMGKEPIVLEDPNQTASGGVTSPISSVAGASAGNSTAGSGGGLGSSTEQFAEAQSQVEMPPNLSAARMTGFLALDPEWTNMWSSAAEDGTISREEESNLIERMNALIAVLSEERETHIDLDGRTLLRYLVRTNRQGVQMGAE